MMHADPATMATLMLTGAGAVGTALRALVSQSQDTFSRKTLADVVIGAFIGGLWPQLGLPMLGTTMLGQAFFIALLSYFTDHALQNYFGSYIEKITGTPPTPPPPKG